MDGVQTQQQNIQIMKCTHTEMCCNVIKASSIMAKMVQLKTNRSMLCWIPTILLLVYKDIDFSSVSVLDRSWRYIYLQTSVSGVALSQLFTGNKTEAHTSQDFYRFVFNHQNWLSVLLEQMSVCYVLCKRTCLLGTSLFDWKFHAIVWVVPRAPVPLCTRPTVYQAHCVPSPQCPRPSVPSPQCPRLSVPGP